MEEENKKLYDLIENENQDTISKFLKSYSPKIWEYRYEEDDNSTVLHIAASNNSYSIMQTLIDYIERNNKNNLKSFINEENNLGITALHNASYKGNLNIVKLLIEKGADMTIISKRKLNIIHYCAQGKRPNSLMYYYLKFKNLEDISEKENLLKLFKNPDIDGSTPLHWAAYSNSILPLLYLINLDIFRNENEKQEFIDKKNNKGYTALHLCAKKDIKYEKIIIKLLENGATPDIRDNLNETPYDLAITKNLLSIGNKIKDYQGCQVCKICKLIPPLKKNNKNKKIIMFLFLSFLISLFIMIFSSFPIVLSYCSSFLPIKIIFFAYLFIAILFIIFYILLLKRDPGVIPSNNISYLNGLINENKDLTYYCYKCFIRKKKLINHCIICDKCFDGFSHHCYLINKCVARKNYCLYTLFLIEIFIYLFFTLIINILVFMFYYYFDDFTINKDLFSFVSSPEISTEKINLKYIHLGANAFHLLLVIIFFFYEWFALLYHFSNSSFRNKNIYKEGNDNRNESLLSDISTFSNIIPVLD